VAVGVPANIAPVSTTGSSTTLTVDAQNAGDILVLLVHVVDSTDTVSSVSGGGASVWALDQQDSDAFGTTHHDTEIWQGEVSAPGTSDITVGFSSPLTGLNIDVFAQEFTAGLGSATTWSKDVGADQSNAAASTEVDYPPLTPSATGELYFGYAWVPGNAIAGSTPGVNYDFTYDGNMICFDPAVSSELAPVASQDAAAESATIAVLIRAS